MERWRQNESAVGLADGVPGLDRDLVLVERLRRQETGAVEALVSTYGDRVYRLAIRITGSVRGIVSPRSLVTTMS